MYSFFIALSVLTNHGWYLGPKMPEPIFFIFFIPLETWKHLIKSQVFWNGFRFRDMEPKRMHSATYNKT